MGCMLRSDFMTLFDLYLQPETAFKILAYLGEVGCVQFLDMNQNVQAFRRCYVSEICRCSEIERILRYMEDEMKKHNIPPGRSRFDPKPLMPNEMLPLENMLEKWESELLELSANNANLLKLYSEMTEMHYVLDSVEPMLGDAEIRNALLPQKFLKEEDITRDLQGKGGQLMLVTGVVRRVRSYAFQMMLWRISLGNIYYRQAQEDRIFKDASGQEERKVAFLVICQGDRLHDRVLKICSGFRANLYPCPRTADDRHVMNKDIGIKLEDQKVVLAKTRYQRCKALYTVAQQWGTWKMRVKKTKAIYHTMNLFNLDITRKCLIGRCWVPDADVHKVQRCLKYYSDKLETPVESFLIKSSANEKPPTFHRTNKFTHGFQALINAYGESYYRELNPALYTVITFPFLFAVMFGDLGHGLILVVSATWMIVKERKIMALRSNNEIFNIAFNGRYVILMLGLFTIVTGFIYNDVFSRGLRLMDPYWINNKTKADIRSKHFITLNPSGSTGKYPYFFGMDPVWKDATNKIVIENSFKMKMSIILGVVHMLFGLCLAFFNNIYFKKYCYIFLEVIPSVLILCSIFLWMVFLIYAKWIYFDPKSTDPDRNPACAQLILILIIDLVLVGKTDKKVPEGCSSFFIFGEAQRIIHRVLLVVLIICIPILLFGVPIYKRRKYTKALMAASASSQGSKFRKYRQSVIQKEEARLARQSGVPAFNFGEVMIRQAIHTVEYTLSTVSHTASYLRLWALSLAHSQLAEMLWEMILSEIGLRSCLTGGSFVGTLTLFFIFALWAFFTMSILVIMEGMSAFLHTLRLHWVEFMSKFYHGNGWMFTPFSFASILAEGDTIDAVCNKKKI